MSKENVHITFTSTSSLPTVGIPAKHLTHHIPPRTTSVTMAKTEAELAQEKATFEETIRKFPDFNALIQAAEAGALGSSGSLASVRTADFTENDESSRDAKSAAELLGVMARFFAIKHDDVLQTYGGKNDADAEDAFINIDDMRAELVDKIWEYH